VYFFVDGNWRQAKSEVYFVPRGLRWTLLPKERYGYTFSGRGSNEHPTFQLRGGHSTTELLPSPGGVKYVIYSSGPQTLGCGSTGTGSRNCRMYTSGDTTRFLGMWLADSSRGSTVACIERAGLDMERSCRWSGMFFTTNMQQPCLMVQTGNFITAVEK